MSKNQSVNSIAKLMNLSKGKNCLAFSHNMLKKLP